MTEMVGMNLEVGVDENGVSLEKLQLVSTVKKLVCKEMNEAVLDEDSTLEKDSNMEENSTNIPTKESLVRQTQKVFDEMTERETKLWHEVYRESMDHTRKLTDMDDFGKISCDSHSIKHLFLMKSLSCLSPEPPPSQICCKNQSPPTLYISANISTTTQIATPSLISIPTIVLKPVNSFKIKLCKSIIFIYDYKLGRINTIARKLFDKMPRPKIGFQSRKVKVLTASQPSSKPPPPQWHQKNARSVLSMSSNSIMFLCFDMNLLYEIIDDAKECHKAFAIENSIVDLDKEKYGGHKISIFEVTIFHVESWMENKGIKEHTCLFIPVTTVMEKQLAAEQIFARVLIKIKKIAEEAKDVGLIVGLNVMRTINEPTVTTISYGFDRKGTSSGEKNVLIFVIGVGIFVVSLVEIEEGNFKVKTTAGDTRLGGEHFKNRVVNHFVEELKLKKHMKDIMRNSRALRRLKSACKGAKKTLPFRAMMKIKFKSLVDGIDMYLSISHAKFEETYMDLFEKCMKSVETCLKDANMDKSWMDDVVYVDGSSKIPKVQQLLQGLFNSKMPCTSINSEEVVSYDATVKAAILSGECKESVQVLVFMYVTPLSLGTRCFGDVMSVLVPRSTNIPAKEGNNYVTVYDIHIRGWIIVLKVERSRASDNNILPGVFVLAAEIKVCFDIDARGTLKVSTEENWGGQKNEITNTTNNKGMLSWEDIEKMVQEVVERYKREDEKHKRVEVKTYCSRELCIQHE
ncbi:heat shock protein 70 [Perilla frutescens var. hirtella]|nr:heat shock protein 70 [Perilla frutescens var. hirtella]